MASLAVVPVGLKAHIHGSRNNPIPLNPGDERVKPVQQQLSYSRLSKVLNAAIQPALKGVRVIGPKCRNQFCQQELAEVFLAGKALNASPQACEKRSRPLSPLPDAFEAMPLCSS